MMDRVEILTTTIDKWSEHMEMYPGQEGFFLSLILAAELEKQMGETEYYKRLCHAGVSTKHGRMARDEKEQDRG